MANKNNTNKWIRIGIIVAVVINLLAILISPFNKLVTLDENVDNAWADVEVQYQRRADLIPNLVATVQGAASFEADTQAAVAALRTRAVAAKQEWDSATNPTEQIAAAKKIDGVAQEFSGLNINVERYPELKATANFASLQDELAGTENRVAVARTRYNEAVNALNQKVRKFPSNIYAGMFGFEKQDRFEATTTGAETAPQVVF
jgi:LemA protein